MAGIPDSWNDAEAALFEEMASHGPPEMVDDGMLQVLYEAALFDFDIPPDQRDTITDSLYDYVWETYGLDFDEVFDWDGYREWYDAA